MVQAGKLRSENEKVIAPFFVSLDIYKAWKGDSTKRARRRICKVAELVGIEHRLLHKPHLLFQIVIVVEEISEIKWCDSFPGVDNKIHPIFNTDRFT